MISNESETECNICYETIFRPPLKKCLCTFICCEQCLRKELGERIQIYEGSHTKCTHCGEINAYSYLGGKQARKLEDQLIKEAFDLRKFRVKNPVDKIRSCINKYNKDNKNFYELPNHEKERLKDEGWLAWSRLLLARIHTKLKLKLDLKDYLPLGPLEKINFVLEGDQQPTEDQFDVENIKSEFFVEDRPGPFSPAPPVSTILPDIIITTERGDLSNRIGEGSEETRSVVEGVTGISHGQIARPEDQQRGASTPIYITVEDNTSEEDLGSDHDFKTTTSSSPSGTCEPSAQPRESRSSGDSRPGIEYPRTRLRAKTRDASPRSKQSTGLNNSTPAQNSSDSVSMARSEAGPGTAAVQLVSTTSTTSSMSRIEEASQKSSEPSEPSIVRESSYVIRKRRRPVVLDDEDDLHLPDGNSLPPPPPPPRPPVSRSGAQMVGREGMAGTGTASDKSAISSVSSTARTRVKAEDQETKVDDVSLAGPYPNNLPVSSTTQPLQLPRVFPTPEIASSSPADPLQKADVSTEHPGKHRIRKASSQSHGSRHLDAPEVSLYRNGLIRWGFLQEERDPSGLRVAQSRPLGFLPRQDSPPVMSLPPIPSLAPPLFLDLTAPPDMSSPQTFLGPSIDPTAADQEVTSDDSSTSPLGTLQQPKAALVLIREKELFRPSLSLEQRPYRFRSPTPPTSDLQGIPSGQINADGCEAATSGPSSRSSPRCLDGLYLQKISPFSSSSSLSTPVSSYESPAVISLVGLQPPPRKRIHEPIPVPLPLPLPLPVAAPVSHTPAPSPDTVGTALGRMRADSIGQSTSSALLGELLLPDKSEIETFDLKPMFLHTYDSEIIVSMDSQRQQMSSASYRRGRGGVGKVAVPAVERNVIDLSESLLADAVSGDSANAPGDSPSEAWVSSLDSSLVVTTEETFGIPKEIDPGFCPQSTSSSLSQKQQAQVSMMENHRENMQCIPAVVLGQQPSQTQQFMTSGIPVEPPLHVDALDLLQKMLDTCGSRVEQAITNSHLKNLLKPKIGTECSSGGATYPRDVTSKPSQQPPPEPQTPKDINGTVDSQLPIYGFYGENVVDGTDESNSQLSQISVIKSSATDQSPRAEAGSLQGDPDGSVSQTQRIAPDKKRDARDSLGAPTLATVSKVFDGVHKELNSLRTTVIVEAPTSFRSVSTSLSGKGKGESKISSSMAGKRKFPEAVGSARISEFRGSDPIEKDYSRDSLQERNNNHKRRGVKTLSLSEVKKIDERNARDHHSYRDRRR